MVEFLQRIDVEILRLLNLDLASPYMDRFWQTVTRLHKLPAVQWLAIPALLGLVVYIYRWHALKVIAALALTVAVSDSFCYRVVKRAFDRPRPFQNEEVSEWVRRIGDAHGPSFPSNHAANCFAGATVLSWYFRRRRFWFYTLASLVAVSRVALGVHYPSDVLAGAIIGIFVGRLIIALLLNRSRFFRLPLRVSDSYDQSGGWRSRSRRLSGP